MRSLGLGIIVRDVMVVIAAVITALFVAYQLSVHDQTNRAEIIAGEVLNRAALTSQQLADAFGKMAVLAPEDQCSPKAVTTMRQIDLSSSMLQGIGYVFNGNLRCSSFGEGVDVFVGAPDYVSATNTQFRRQRALSIAPNVPVLMVSDAAGHTGFIHPSLVFNLSDNDGLPAGVVSYSTRDEIIYTGGRDFDWRKVAMPPYQFAGVLMMANHLVAWQRSPMWDHFTYAAVPQAAIVDEFWSLLSLALPAGVLAGVLLLMFVRRVSASRASLPVLLKGGLARKEVHAVFQPIVDLRTGRWVGAEVLARWKRPSGEWISPDVFVPIAEKHGLIGELTRHMIQSCVVELGTFVATNPEFFASINIASMDLADPEFIPRLTRECDTRGIAHEHIHLEITERAEIDPSLEAATIQALRALGFQLGIDDFGIGYSNLSYLDTLHVDYLKIDRLFVAGLTGGGISSDVVDHIIDLGAERGLTLIAEGVENEAQRAALLARGVLLGQGWLFARPMGAQEFARAHAANLATAAESLSPYPRAA